MPSPAPCVMAPTQARACHPLITGSRRARHRGLWSLEGALPPVSLCPAGDGRALHCRAVYLALGPLPVVGIVACARWHARRRGHPPAAPFALPCQSSGWDRIPGCLFNREGTPKKYQMSNGPSSCEFVPRYCGELSKFENRARSTSVRIRAPSFARACRQDRPVLPARVCKRHFLGKH